MTTPTPAGGRPSASPGIPLRSLTAWALLLLAAVIVVFGFLHWIFPSFPHRSFIDRFDFGTFTNISVLAAPLLAMLVATKIGAPVRNAKLLGTLALATYAAALLFAVVAFLVGIADKFDAVPSGFHAFGHILQALGALIGELLTLGVLAVATMWTYRIFTSLGGKLPNVNIQSD